MASGGVSTFSRLRVRSFLPGRIRWDVDVIQDRRDFAARLRELLLEHDGVLSVVANPVSGRVLVHFNPELPTNTVEGWLSEALRRAMSPNGNRGSAGASTDWPGRAVPDAAALGPIRRLVHRMRGMRGLAVMAGAASLTQNVLDMGMPIFTALAINIVARGPNATLLRLFSIGGRRNQILLVAGLHGATWVIESVADYAHHVLWRELAQRVQCDLRTEAYEHLQQLDVSFIEGLRVGRATSLLNEDINQIERFVRTQGDEVINVGATLVVSLGVTFWLIPTVGWVLVGLMPMLLVSARAFLVGSAERYADVSVERARITDRVVGNVAGMATILAFTAEAWEAGRIRAAGQRYMAANWRAIVLSAAFLPTVRLGLLAANTMVVVVAGRQVLDRRLSVGGFAALLGFSRRVLRMMLYLSETTDELQRTTTSLRRVFRLLDERPRVVDPPAPRVVPKDGLTVRFEQVEFAYQPDASVIRGIGLELPEGKTTAIVGPTGCGKTTLVKLLMRFYDVDRGLVSVGGVDVRELDRRELRRAIALVTADATLFHGSVLENIAYGDPSPDRARAERVARMAEAHGFISDMPRAYDAPIAERGVSLSTGQRQRIALARALYRDAPILVLDEATASVDNETEYAIQRSLRQAVIGKTTLIIAHRLSTVRSADWIVVMDRGRIVQEGVHDDLVLREGLYRNLWMLQTGQAWEERRDDQP